MKRFMPLILLIAAFLLVPAGFAIAGTSRSPSKDTTCQKSGSCANNFGVQLTGSNLGATPPEKCSNGQFGYIGWNLSGVSGTTATAELTLTTYSVSGAPASPTAVVFQLVEPNTQNWTENGTDPGLKSNVLATTSVVLSNGSAPQTVSFGGSANPADASTLGSYFQNLKGVGDGTATVGVRISDGCTLSTFVAFNDRENTGNLAGGASATEPDLLLFSPTSVGFYSFRAGSAGTGTLILAGVLLATVLVSGAALLRRRATG